MVARGPMGSQISFPTTPANLACEAGVASSRRPTRRSMVWRRRSEAPEASPGWVMGPHGMERREWGNGAKGKLIRRRVEDFLPRSAGTFAAEGRSGTRSSGVPTDDGRDEPPLGPDHFSGPGVVGQRKVGVSARRLLPTASEDAAPLAAGVGGHCRDAPACPRAHPAACAGPPAGENPAA